jgi:hypothetical protein
VIVETSNVMRGDPGTPPPGPRSDKGSGRGTKRPQAPARDESRGVSPSRQFEPTEDGDAKTKVDWDALAEIAPDDDCEEED